MTEDVTAEQQNGQSRAETPKPDSKLAVGAEVRVSRLNTLVHVRAELGRLYREARKREGRYPDALTASRLALVLGSVQKIIELADFERRLEALEKSRQVNGPRLVPTPHRAA